VVGIGKITQNWGLPVFSLPFCVVVITYLYSLKLRTHPGKLVLTPVQYFSPEQNLYRYLNGTDRQGEFVYFPLQLPVLGEWMVSQGYQGLLTHKGEWAQALDFVILDHEMKTYQHPGNRVEHFYCYNKPVLAPGDGIIEEVIDYIPDNEVGFNNLAQNWGNSIVIKHTEGLYSKLSHLRQHSIKVMKGQYVRQGDILAMCGNSGRSPEPHLHFQIQRTPYVGSKTIAYPLTLFESRKNDRLQLNRFAIPDEGSFVRNLQPNQIWTNAFSFQPGFCLQVQASGWEMEEWEVKTSAYNETYFFCEAKQVAAYFVARGQSFYFTNYFGTKRSLLFYFYQAAYRLILSNDAQVPVVDHLPVNLYARAPFSWWQDLLAPLYIFTKQGYRSYLQQKPQQLMAQTSDIGY
ncbi:MAG TPA: M23 family metallopeptidase, partial [Ferruginibacter sp.]|nr:M23 family metallopeptidase [Ferruginibacter sp.]